MRRAGLILLALGAIIYMAVARDILAGAGMFLLLVGVWILVIERVERLRRQ